MGFFSYSIDFWFIVVQALSLRCFTLTVRPRVAFASPKPRALPLLLFRRLRAMEGPACSCFSQENKITHQKEYPEPYSEILPNRDGANDSKSSPIHSSLS